MQIGHDSLEVIVNFTQITCLLVHAPCVADFIIQGSFSLPINLVYVGEEPVATIDPFNEDKKGSGQNAMKLST